MEYPARTVAVVAVSGTLIGAFPTVATASQPWRPAASASAVNAVSAGGAAHGRPGAETGVMPLLLGGGVMYDRRTIRWGPCYGALDATRSRHHYYVMARFYSYHETCRDELVFVSHHRRAAISRLTAYPNQWAEAPAWYLDSARNAAVCVSIDDFNYDCTASY